MNGHYAPRLAGLAAVAALGLAAGCETLSESTAATDGGEGRSGRLTLTGSSTVAPLAMEIGRRFERRHPGVRVDVQTGGSSRGIADVRSGAAEVGMASRGLAPDERELRAHRIAVDGVGMIVHADNPVSGLSDAAVRAVYTGEVGSWREIGGPATDVVVVHKAEGRATLEVFLAHFSLDNAAVDADVIVGDNQQAIRTVAGNRHAIGYVSIGSAGFEADRGVPIKLLAVGGVAPTSTAVADGSFPITRPLNLVTRGEASGLVAEFLRYARSEAVRDLVEAQGFVPISQ